MKNLKNIFTIAIIFVVLNIATLWIFKILNFIRPEDFSGVLIDSLSIIGIIFLLISIISIIPNIGKNN